MVDFEMPTLITPKHRTSSITNAFTNGFMPQIDPTDAEIEDVLSIFQQSRGNEMRCVYCDEPATEWDHFRPLINNKKPTGFITEIYNLVPCCHTCNGSKGAKKWGEYLESTSKKSARTRLSAKRMTHLIDPQGVLYENLRTFEEWSDTRIHRINFVYDDNENNICSIEVFEGQNLIRELTLEDDLTREVAQYYSQLQEINQSLINVTENVRDLSNRVRDIFEPNNID